MSNSDIIKQFLKAIEADNKDDILSFFSEDCIFHNIPMKPVTGKEAIWQILAMLQEPAEKVFWELHHIAETEDGKVMTERTDYFHLPEKSIACRVMGIFELSDGKITHWRDYFDMQQVAEQL